MYKMTQVFVLYLQSDYFISFKEGILFHASIATNGSHEEKYMYIGNLLCLLL